MRLSDLLDKAGSRGAASGPGRTEAEAAAASADKKLVPSPEAQKPEERQRPVRADTRRHESMPDAILRAAEQLAIPIPQTSRLVLRNGKESLSQIIQTATKAEGGKDGLWEATLQLVHDLSQLLAMNSSLGHALEYDPGEKESLVSHSLNTCLVAMDLAQRMDSMECSIQEIGAAGLLHDVGTAALSLDSFDDRAVSSKEHVAQSLRILDEMNVPKLIKTVVSQHHERTDGTGYPNGISGTSLLISSQVLALSATFERFLFRSFRESSHEGVLRLNPVQATLKEFHKALDRKVLKAFISLRGFYPDGIMVELTNHAICLVLRQNEGFPLQPVVQVVVDSAGNHQTVPRIMDLRHHALSIIHALTNDEGQG